MMKAGEMTAIKAILVMGVLTLLLLWLLAEGLRYGLERRPKESVAASKTPSLFDGQRAYRDLETIVGMGPRPSGSEALDQLREFVKTELTKAGLNVWEHRFEAETPIGVLPMVNVVAKTEGTKPGVIILGNHYETKHFPEFTFVGANDGGSTTAWMLEMARAVGPKREGRSVWLCFFDGEEAFKEWSATDSLYGSRAFVAHLKESGRFSEIRAMINVDMIGDCYLGITRDTDAPEWLNQRIWRNARALGYGSHFLRASRSIEDDHVPFRTAGIPAIDIIDFCYGANRLEHEQNWHTANDTLERVCAESLQVVGDVIYHSLTDIDAYLNKLARN
ncbi:MAG TPA: M28 family peptidase [Candidatus Hydrogenedentes bacterium]|nr:M28 family peptidase [Candidatus Hydrogenedentota bacterium]